MDSATTGCGSSTKNSCSISGDVRGVCPDGWHLPSLADWNMLLGAIGDSTISGTALKSNYGWLANRNGEDFYGFSAMPGGYWTNTGSYTRLASAYFWSSTETANNRGHAYYMFFYDRNEYADLRTGTKTWGHSIRCVKDTTY